MTIPISSSDAIDRCKSLLIIDGLLAPSASSNRSASSLAKGGVTQSSHCRLPLTFPPASPPPVSLGPSPLARLLWPVSFGPSPLPRLLPWPVSSLAGLGRRCPGPSFASPAMRHILPDRIYRFAWENVREERQAETVIGIGREGARVNHFDMKRTLLYIYIYIYIFFFAMNWFIFPGCLMGNVSFWVVLRPQHDESPGFVSMLQLLWSNQLNCFYFTFLFVSLSFSLSLSLLIFFPFISFNKIIFKKNNNNTNCVCQIKWNIGTPISAPIIDEQEFKSTQFHLGLEAAAALRGVALQRGRARAYPAAAAAAAAAALARPQLTAASLG